MHAKILKPEVKSRDFIRRVFVARTNRNPHYSLRAFARDLEISPSFLSEVLNGHHGVTQRMACAIKDRLDLNRAEEKQFMLSVAYENAGSESRKRDALKALKQSSKHFAPLKRDVFHAVSNWQHLAILQLHRVKDFKPSNAWLSRRMNLPIAMVQDSIVRLKKIGLLKGDGADLAPNDEAFSFDEKIPPDFIRTFHRDLLKKADEAVGKDPSSRRLDAMVFAMKKEKMPEAIASIRAFYEKFDREFGASSGADEVYALTTQLFNLTERKTE